MMASSADALEPMARSDEAVASSQGRRLRQKDALFELVYRRLKSMAHRELSRGGIHSLDTTALVHEAYLRFGDSDELRFDDRNQFLLYAARAMRHILVDRARHRAAFRFGGEATHTELTDVATDTAAVSTDVALALDSALDDLEKCSERAARVVELHFFAGLPMEEVAQTLGVVRRTVIRDWRFARAYLLAQID